jgi:hypothetical protein
MGHLTFFHLVPTNMTFQTFTNLVVYPVLLLSRRKLVLCSGNFSRTYGPQYFDSYFGAVKHAKLTDVDGFGVYAPPACETFSFEDDHLKETNTASYTCSIATAKVKLKKLKNRINEVVLPHLAVLKSELQLKNQYIYTS